MRNTLTLAAAALLSACAANAPEPGPMGAREAIVMRAALAQIERVAKLSDEEAEAELAAPLAEGKAVTPAADRPRLETLDHWIAALRCAEKPTVAARGECYSDAVVLHEAADRMKRKRLAREAVRT